MQNTRTAAVLLAAGCSSRFGSNNKLLEPVNDIPILQHSLQAIFDSALQQCILVTGHEAADIEAVAENHPISIVHNPDYRLGISGSIKVGIQAVHEDIDAAVIVLGDMPGIDRHIIDTLVSAFNPGQGHEICVPTFRGRRGNPVLWGRRLFSDLCMLEGDIGGRQLIGQYKEAVKECECFNEAVHIDIDTITDLIDRKPVSIPQEISDES